MFTMTFIKSVFNPIMSMKSILLLSAFLLMLGGCAVLQTPPALSPVYSLEPAEEGVLSEVSRSISARYKQAGNGFLLLKNNEEALKWRLALVDHALLSLDIQYYIWQDDETGNLLLERILKAADRGVRVRLLIDDFLLSSNSKDLTLLASHENLDIKIFNPGYVRENSFGSMWEYMADLQTLNRRMHNKLFIADGHMAIVGGRNIGNPYFGLSKKYNFRDLDVLVAGSVVKDMSVSFDTYWNDEQAYPGAHMSTLKEGDNLSEVRDKVADVVEEGRNLLQQYPLEPQSWREELQQLGASMKPGEAYYLQDIPARKEERDERLLDILDKIAKPSEKELFMVAPYLIPDRLFLDGLTEMAGNGVKISLITNSLGSNNHTMVNSHYKKYRRDLLDTGAELFEFRHDPGQNQRHLADVSPVRAGFISLHTKAMVADGKLCFIGSLNLDPRAIKINTENGLYIESEELADELLLDFKELSDGENSWQVIYDSDGKLRWHSASGTVDRQPSRSFGQRIADFFYWLMPIESQL